MTAYGLAVVLDEWGYRLLGVMLSLLWQSSIVLISVWALSFMLRHHAAKIRHLLWFSGIILAPLSLLINPLTGLLHSPASGIAVMPEYISPVPDNIIQANIPSLTEPVVINRPLIGRAEYSQQTQKSYPWMSVIPVYVCGSGVMFLLIVLGRYRIGRWKRNGRKVEDPRIGWLVDKTGVQTGVNRTVLFIEHDMIPAPFVSSVGNPAVLLPKGYITSLSDEDLYALIVHEIKHIDRCDPLTLTIISIIRAALFFHPLIWFAARRVATEAEYACDEAVLAAVVDPAVYAEQLVNLAKRFQRPMVSAEIAAGLVWNRHAFVRRIEAILAGRDRRVRIFTRATGIGIAATICLALAVAASAPLTERKYADSPLETNQMQSLQPAQTPLFSGENTELSELAQVAPVRRPTSPTPPVSSGVSGVIGPERTGLSGALTANGLSLDMLEGDWLNSDYIDILKATRSPKAAVEAVSWTEMTFEKDVSDNVYNWLQIINFHEGLPFRLTGITVTEDENLYRPVYENYRDTGTTRDSRFIISQPFPPDEIEWRFDVSYESDERNETFVRIPEERERFINRIVIAGRYIDETGELYTFTEDGVAVWPDMTFTYSIEVDYMDGVSTGNDVMRTGIPSQVMQGRQLHYSYGFTWEDNKLLLYETSYNAGFNLEQKLEPFVILTSLEE